MAQILESKVFFFFNKKEGDDECSQHTLVSLKLSLVQQYLLQPRIIVSPLVHMLCCKKDSIKSQNEYMCQSYIFDMHTSDLKLSAPHWMNINGGL
jgi:hypothetical protein